MGLVGELHGSLLASRHVHVLRLSFNVFLTLGLLASVAVLATLEVVVLALGALPTPIREPEVILAPLLLLLGLPGLVGIHLGYKHWHLIILVILSLKTVHFLGKLIHGGYEWSSLLIEL